MKFLRKVFLSPFRRSTWGDGAVRSSSSIIWPVVAKQPIVWHGRNRGQIIWHESKQNFSSFDWNDMDKARVTLFLNSIGWEKCDQSRLIDSLVPFSRSCLKTLACGDKEVPNTLVSELQRFRERVSGWSSSSACMFWDAYPPEVQKEFMVYKAQTNGTCAVICSVVAQHNIVVCNRHALGMSVSGVGMLDVPSFLRTEFIKGPDELSLYLSKNNPGAHTIDVLRRMGNLTAKDYTTYTPDPLVSAEAYCAVWRAKLKTAPLVVTLTVFEDMGHNDLSSPGKFSYGDEDALLLTERSKLQGRHAMLMVGSRVDDKGTVWFALQNWWKDKIFLEVTFAYLKACSASVTSVEKQITEIAMYGVEINYKMSLETCLDKCAEQSER